MFKRLKYKKWQQIIEMRLNCKNGCLKHSLKFDIVGVNKGFFTYDCKKALKYA